MGDIGYASATDPLFNAFDTEIGPDGNLYVSSQGLGDINDPAGACVIRFNIADATGASDAPVGGANYGDWDVFVTNHGGNLVQAKTLHFSSNNVDANIIVPEPGSVAFGIIAAGSVLGLIARKRKA